MSKPPLKYRIRFKNIFIIILMVCLGYFYFQPKQVSNNEEEVCVKDTINQVIPQLPPKKPTRAEQLIQSIKETSEKWEVYYFHHEHIPRNKLGIRIPNTHSLRHSIIFVHREKDLVGQMGVEIGRHEIQPSISFSGIFDNKYKNDEVAFVFREGAKQKFHKRVNTGIDLGLNVPKTEQSAYEQLIWSLKNQPTKWNESYGGRTYSYPGTGFRIEYWENKEGQYLEIDFSKNPDFWYGKDIAEKHFPKEIYDNRFHDDGRLTRFDWRKINYYHEICMEVMKKFVLTDKESKSIIKELSKREQVDWDL